VCVCVTCSSLTPRTSFETKAHSHPLFRSQCVVAPPSSVVKSLWEVFVWRFGVLFLSCCVCRCWGCCSLSVCVYVCVTCSCLTPPTPFEPRAYSHTLSIHTPLFIHTPSPFTPPLHSHPLSIHTPSPFTPPLHSHRAELDGNASLCVAVPGQNELGLGVNPRLIHTPFFIHTF